MIGIDVWRFLSRTASVGVVFAALLLYLCVSAAAMQRENIGNLAPDAGATFGAAIAADGDVLVVGEPGASRVHLFQQSNGEWHRSAVIEPPADDAQFGPDRPGFGYSVAVNSKQILIGAYREQLSGNMSGAAYVGSNAVGYFGAVYRRDIGGNDNPYCLYGPCSDGWKSGYIAGHVVHLNDSFAALAVRYDRGDGIWLGQIDVISASGNEISIVPEGMARIGFSMDFDMSGDLIAALSPAGDGSHPQAAIYKQHSTGVFEEVNRWNLEFNPEKIAVDERLVVVTSNDRGPDRLAAIYDHASIKLRELKNNGDPFISSKYIVMLGNDLVFFKKDNFQKLFSYSGPVKAYASLNNIFYIDYRNDMYQLY